MATRCRRVKILLRFLVRNIPKSVPEEHLKAGDLVLYEQKNIAKKNKGGGNFATPLAVKLLTQ
jgi:spore maturation protein SpmA